MIVILAALLAGKTVLPHIDRQSLELQARAEALQTRSAPRPALRRANTTGLDFSQITTICRAAGNQHNPAAFLTRISTAYSLSSNDTDSLRSSCAAYIAGHADAQRER